MRSEPLRSRASTTTTAWTSPLISRLRNGKWGAAGGRPGESSLTTAPASWPAQPLHGAEGPFSVSMVNETLEEIGGEAFEVASRSGRPVPARYVRGTDHPIMLSGGQHPNEISGVAGALRGASLLSER